MKLDQGSLITFTAASFLVTLICAWWVPALTWFFFTLTLAGLAVIACRWAANDSTLTMIILGSFTIRACLAISLFAVSYFQLPILSSLQYEGTGFWVFGGDAIGYHDHGEKLINAWHQGIDFPSVFIAGINHYDLYKGLSLPIAIVYAVLGSLPLHFLLVNAFVGAMIGLLAYNLTLRLSDRRSALIAATAVAFWPSSILWSTQLLKDMISIALVMLSLLLIVNLWKKHSITTTQQDRNVLSHVGEWLLLVVAVFGVTYFRNYMGALFVVTVTGVMSLAGLRSVWRRNWRQTFLAFGLIFCVFGATAAGTDTNINLLYWLSPRNPEVGHVKLGLAYEAGTVIKQSRVFHWDMDDDSRAVASYLRAIELNQEYAPAYRQLGLALLKEGQLQVAVQSFENYLLLEEDPELIRSLKSILSTKGLVLSETPTFTDVRLPAIGLEPKESIGGVVGDIVKNVGILPNRSWPEHISNLRQAITSTGGSSVVDAQQIFNHLWDVIAFMPRALLIAFLAPFPWEVLFGGKTAGLQPLAVPDNLLIICLLPALALAYWQRLRRFQPDEWFLLAFVLVTAVGHGLVMANAGTLFRLRLQFLIPAIVLAATALPSVIAGVFALFGRSNSNFLPR